MRHHKPAATGDAGGDTNAGVSMLPSTVPPIKSAMACSSGFSGVPLLKAGCSVRPPKCSWDPIG